MSKFDILNQIIFALAFPLQEVFSVHQLSTSEDVQDIGGIMNTLVQGVYLDFSEGLSSTSE